MGASIFKQPNGLLGRYSYVSDGFTNYNMTEEEYIINKIENSVQDSKDTLKRWQRDYKDVINDAIKYEDTYDNWINDSKPNKKEKEKLLKQKERRHLETQAYIKAMNEDPSQQDKDYHKYCHELYNMIDNFCIYYDLNDYKYNKKPYFLLNYPEDIKLFTEKIKELNAFFNKIKEQRIKENKEE